MDRKSSTARAEEAWRLRCTGRTWSEVATECGYRRHDTARKAVAKFLQKNPPDDLETMRRMSGEMLITTAKKLGQALDSALDADKTRDAAELGKAIFAGVGEWAKLTGQHITQPKQVDVTVTQTITEVIAHTRERLMAVIDADFIDVTEQPAPRQVEA